MTPVGDTPGTLVLGSTPAASRTATTTEWPDIWVFGSRLKAQRHSGTWLPSHFYPVPGAEPYTCTIEKFNLWYIIFRKPGFNGELHCHLTYDDVHCLTAQRKSRGSNYFLDWPSCIVRRVLDILFEQIDYVKIGNNIMNIPEFDFVWLFEALDWPTDGSGRPYLPERELSIIAKSYFRAIKNAYETPETKIWLPDFNNKRKRAFFRLFRKPRTIKNLAAFCLSTGRFPNRNEWSVL